MKRVLSLLLTLTTLMGILPLGVLAADDGLDSKLSDTQYSEVKQYDAANAEDLMQFAADGFESGNGTAEAPYIIRTPQQLIYWTVSAHQGETYEGQYLSLAGHIDMSGYSWMPIHSFKGTLYGNNFSVSNLKIDSSSYIPAVNGTYGIGLIAANYGTVNDLNLTDITINVSCADYVSCGAIVGINHGIVSNCDAGGSIIGAATESNTGAATLWVGGIVGYAYENAEIRYCIGSASVVGSCPNGSVYVGGIVGWCFGTVIACSASGGVSSNGKNAYAGGLIGQISGRSIQSSYATAAVSATSASNPPVAGGLTGAATDTAIIQKSYYAGASVTSVATGANIDAYCGGLVGLIGDCNIYNSFTAACKIVASTKVDDASGDDLKGCGYAGQIIGYDLEYVTRTIIHCCYSTDISIQRTTAEAFITKVPTGSGCNKGEKEVTKYKHNTATTPSVECGSYIDNESLCSQSLIADTLKWPMYTDLPSAMGSSLNVWLSKGSYPELFTAYTYSAVVVKYMDGTVFEVYHQLCESGDSFQYSPESYDNYESSVDTISETITENKVYTVMYGRITHNYSIVCKDQHGNVIGISTSSIGEGLEFTITVPEITGYTPRESTVSGTMGTEDLTSEILYDANEYTVTIRYMDESGNFLAPVHQSTRLFGESVSVRSPEVVGYKVMLESDSEKVIDAKLADDFSYAVRYMKADDKAYTITAMLGTTPLSSVTVTFNGKSLLTDSHGQATFSYPYGATTATLQIHKDGFYSGIYENEGEYTLKSDLGIDYFNLKYDTAEHPDYSIEGITCYGSDINKGYGTINVSYDGYIPIVVKSNLPGTDRILKMQLVQEVESILIEEDDSVIEGSLSGEMVRKVLKTVHMGDEAFEIENGVPTGVCVFNLMGTQFSHDKETEYPIYVYMYTEYGNEPVVQKLNINTIKFVGDIKFDGLFDNVAVSLEDTGLSFLDGTKVSFELGDKYKLNNPFSIEVHNNELYIAYDVAKTDDFKYAVKTYSPQTWNDYKKVNDAAKRADDYMKYIAQKADEKFAKGNWKDPKHKGSFSLEASAAGGMCFTIYRSGNIATYSYFKLGVVAKASWTSDFVVIFIPITVKVSISAEGEITITGLGYDFEHQKLLFPSTELSLSAKFEMSAGIGNRNISAGAFGRFTIGTTLVIGEKTYFDALILNGEGGFYAKLDVGLFSLYGEKAWKFLEKKIEFVIFDATPQYDSLTEGVGYVGMYNGLPVYEVSAYDLLQEAEEEQVVVPEWTVNKAKILENPTADSEEDFYQMIDNANGRISTLNGQKIAVYFAQSTSRDPANGKVLVYSTAENNYYPWSAAQCVDDNGTADTEFDIIEYRGKLYIAYSEANRTFDASEYASSTELINDTAFAQDIRVAVYDPDSRSFVSVAKITADSHYDTMPTFGIVNDVLYLVWNKNTSHDDNTVFCMNAENEIWFSMFNGGDWLEPTLVTSGCYPIADITVAALSGQPYIACIIDEDASLYTDSDKNLYISDLYGNMTFIQCYGTAISDLQAITHSGRSLLIWKSNDRIMALSAITENPYVFYDKSLGEDYTFVNINDNLSALLWAEKDIEPTAQDETVSSRIYASYLYADNEWTTPICLTSVPYHLMSFDVAPDQSTLCCLFTDTYMLSGEDNALTSYSKLCYESYSLPTVLTQNDAVLTVDEETNKVRILVTVTNNGAVSIGKIKVTLSDTIMTPTDSGFIGVIQPGALDTQAYKKTVNSYPIGEYTVNLFPGQTKVITAEINLTDEMVLNDYSIYTHIVYSGATDDNVSLGRPVTILETLYPDLSVTGEYIILGETEYLSLRVENIGEGSADAILHLWRMEEDGSETSVYTVTIGNLMENNVKYYLIKLEKDFFESTFTDFKCQIDCQHDLDESNNTITVKARKLEGAAGNPEDLLVQAPELSDYLQVFDKYVPQDIILTVTTNEDLVRFVGCIDENQDPVAPSLIEDGNTQQFTFSSDELSLLDTGLHEFTFLYLTGVGYIGTVYTINVIDSTPILTQGNVFITASDAPIDTCQRGTKLSVDVSSVNAALLTYEWIIDGQVVSTEPTYTVDNLYLGFDIQARITGVAPYYGSLTTQCVHLEMVERTLKSPVVIDDSSENTVILQKAFHVGDDTLQYGYATVNDSSAVTEWQYSNTLHLPERGTYYLFAKATDSRIYAPVVSGATKYSNAPHGSLGGTISCFTTEAKEITVQLIPKGETEPAYEITQKPGDDYLFTKVTYGAYTVIVSEESHVTSSYTVVIEGDTTTLNVEIFLLEDVNKDRFLNISDVNDMLCYLAGVDEQKDLNLDLDSNGYINVNDLNLLLIKLSSI
ncbi:MAG: hypothetical protein E7599_02820 [Ruminococcaceae bacterium]|nr:hypothetical protein [Oscillospiraceae bacterium]